MDAGVPNASHFVFLVVQSGIDPYFVPAWGYHMALFSTTSVALSLGVALGKALLKQWGGGELVEAMGDALLKEAGEGTRAALTDRAESQRLATVVASVASDLGNALQHEIGRLDKGDREALLREVALTLAHLDAALVVDGKLDAERIAEALLRQRPDATKLLGDAPSHLYERMIALICQRLEPTLMTLQGIEQELWRYHVQRTDTLVELVEELLARPSHEDEEYRREYYNEILRRLDRLDLFGIGSPVDTTQKYFPLSSAYLSLKVQRASTLSAEERAQLDELLADLTMDGSTAADRVALRAETWLSDPRHQRRLLQQIAGKEIAPLLHQLRSKQLSFEQAVTTEPRILLVGEGGSGKTTLLRWLAVRLANGDCPPTFTELRDYTPFYIRLRDWITPDNADHRGFPPPELFTKLMRTTVGEMPSGWTHRQLRSGRAVVLIDGVDELPYELRDRLLDEVDCLLRAFPYARYLISSRPEAVDSERWPEWKQWTERHYFAPVRLQRMDRQEIELFIDKWHRAAAEAEQDVEEREKLPATGERLKRLLIQRPRVQQLAETPLLCALICALHRDEKEDIPNNRAKLYDLVLDMLFWKRDSKRDVPLPPPHEKLKSTDNSKQILGDLALWMFENGESTTEADKFDKELVNAFALLRLYEIDPAKVRNYYIERSNVIWDPVVDQQVEFVHRTLQEYLAALRLPQRSKVPSLYERIDDPAWRGVITLVMASRVTPNHERRALHKKILTFSGRLDNDKIRRRKLLALATLESADHGWLTPGAEQAAIEQCCDLFPPQTMEDARDIAAVGEAAVPHLAYNEAHSEDENAASIRALAMIGGAKALQTLEGYVAAMPDAADRTWWGGVPPIAQEIGQVWDYFDQEEFAHRILHRLTALWLPELTVPVGELTNLQLLSLDNTPVADLAPLHALANLQRLDLDNTPVADLDPLASLSGLLTMSLNGTEVADLAPLHALSNLELLYLNNTPVADLAPLHDLANLRWLSLNNTPVSDEQVSTLQAALPRCNIIR